jgi:hypothetical protein
VPTEPPDGPCLSALCRVHTEKGNGPCHWQVHPSRHPILAVEELSATVAFWPQDVHLWGHFPDRGTTCPFSHSVLLVASASPSPPPGVHGVCIVCPFPRVAWVPEVMGGGWCGSRVMGGDCCCSSSCGLGHLHLLAQLLQHALGDNRARPYMRCSLHWQTSPLS